MTIFMEMEAVKTTRETFTYEEALKSSVRYFHGDELAASTWLNKYAMKDKSGQLLEATPDDLHKRMAVEFARIEDGYSSKKLAAGKHDQLSDYGKERKPLRERDIYELFRNFKYVIPQGSVMSSLGNPHMLASLSNCVVLPELFDSYGGIFFADQQLAQLFKRRCGVGLDISTLRPEGFRVSNAAGTASGAVSFMERFSNTTREVSQNGRRGALMITMDVAHPDIGRFIKIKQDLSKVTGANISVRLSDEFMNAVSRDGEFMLKFPVDSETPEYVRSISARSLWNAIIRCAHNTAEPGLIFWDRQHHYSTSSVYPGFRNVSTNPCSEIAMQGGDSCRLIALNLFSFVNHAFTEKAEFDFEKFYRITYESQRLMDDLVDLELEAIDRIMEKVLAGPEPDYIKEVEIRTWKLLREAGKTGRRTGLGFTALADALAGLGLRFDTGDALKMTERIMKEKCRAEFNSSIDMAIERGSFDAFDSAIEETSEFVAMLKSELQDVYSRMMKHGRRNISISTVAPTGSISLLARTSSGIEPVFMLSYKRRRKINAHDKNARIDFVDHSGDAWQEFNVYHPKLNDWMEVTGEKDISLSPYAGATAMEIDWKKRVELQAIVQKYTTHSISSTINLPQSISDEIVGKIYLDAWRKGLKGITVYREGSRSGVLVSDAGEESKKSANREVPRRPKTLEADVVRFLNNDKKWIAYVGLLEGKPYEVFTGLADDAFNIPDWVVKGWIIKNKAGGKKARYDFQYMDREGYRITIEGLSRSFDKEFWNYAKLLSGVLRHGMPLIHVVDLIENLNLFSDNINNWKSGVARALKKYIPNGTQAVDRLCTECGDPEGLYYEEGCLKCKSCGHSKCG